VWIYQAFMVGLAATHCTIKVTSMRYEGDLLAAMVGFATIDAMA